MTAEIIEGDCLAVLPTLADASVDAVVTDPPYGLGFMGKEWDKPGSFVKRKADKRNNFDHVGGNHNPTCPADAARTRHVEGRKFQAWCDSWARECLRVLKPGGCLLAFGGTRTYHRMACAIEDAGFEIRDSIACFGFTLQWCFGSGFPKGKGCLKPAHEPIILARRPGPKVLPLGIDACRVPIAGPIDPVRGGYATPGNGHVGSGGIYEGGYAGIYDGAQQPHPDSPRHDVRGRFPPNLVMSHHPDCERIGVKRVKGSHDNGKALPRNVGGQYSGGFAGTGESRGYTAPDGTEAVEAWRCVEGCPILEMDRQSPGVSRFFPVFSWAPDDLIDPSCSFPYDGKNNGGQPCQEKILRGGVSTSETVDGIDSGVSPGAESNTPNSKAGGCGNRRTVQSRRDTKSITGTMTQPTTTCPTSNVSQPSGTTTTINGYEKTIDSSTASNIAGAPGAENTGPSPNFTDEPQGLSRDTVNLAPANLTGNGSSRIKSESGNTSKESENGHSPRSGSVSVVQGLTPARVREVGSAPSPAPRSSTTPSEEQTESRFFPTFAFEADDFAPFFYCAKASRRERNEGLEGMAEHRAAEHDDRNPCVNGVKLNGSGLPTNGTGMDRPQANHHPCVKPQMLMRWLVRLVVPPGGLVLDPFAGSGSTGVAAIREGFRFIGIEQSPEYCAIARARLDKAAADRPLLAPA